MENWYDNSKTQITVLHLHETSMMWIEYCSSSEPKSVLVSSDLFKYLDVLGTFFFFFFLSLFVISICAVRRSSWPLLSSGWGDGCGRSWSQDESRRLVLLPRPEPTMGPRSSSWKLLELLLCTTSRTLWWTGRAMTLWSPRGLVVHYIFPLYFISLFFQPCLKWPEKWPFTPESPKTRIKPEHCSTQHVFWVYHKRSGCLFTLYTSSFCLGGSSFFRNVLCDCNIDKKRKRKKKNSQHLSPLPN